MANVYTGGTFDLFHHGHMKLLRFCERLAGPDGQVVVAVNSDEFVNAFKNERPVLDLCDRLASVYQFMPKAQLLICSDYDSRELIETQSAYPINYVVIGNDWLGKDYLSQMNFTREWLEQHDISIVFVPYTSAISATEIKRRIRER